MRYVDLVAAAFLVLSGVYLLYYFAAEDASGGTSITDSVQRFQGRLSTTLANRWELIALVLAAVVTAAVVFVARRPRSERA
jgi:hypothetical protein